MTVLDAYTFWTEQGYTPVLLGKPESGADWKDPSRCGGGVSPQGWQLRKHDWMSEKELGLLDTGHMLGILCGLSEIHEESQLVCIDLDSFYGITKDDGLEALLEARERFIVEHAEQLALLYWERSPKGIHIFGTVSATLQLIQRGQRLVMNLWGTNVGYELKCGGAGQVVVAPSYGYRDDGSKAEYEAQGKLAEAISNTWAIGELPQYLLDILDELGHVLGEGESKSRMSVNTPDYFDYNEDKAKSISTGIRSFVRIQRGITSDIPDIKAGNRHIYLLDVANKIYGALRAHGGGDFMHTPDEVQSVCYYYLKKICDYWKSKAIGDAIGVPEMVGIVIGRYRHMLWSIQDRARFDVADDDVEGIKKILEDETIALPKYVRDRFESTVEVSEIQLPDAVGVSVVAVEKPAVPSWEKIKHKDDMNPARYLRMLMPHDIYVTELGVWYFYNETTGGYAMFPTDDEAQSRVYNLGFAHGIFKHENGKSVAGKVRSITADLKLACGRPHALRMGKTVVDTSMKLQGRDGVIDCATGELLPHSALYEFEGSSNAVYTGLDTVSPVYDKFMLDMFEGNVMPIEQINMYLGLTVAGINPQELMLSIVGPQGSGKSTLGKIVSHILGNLCMYRNLEELHMPFGLARLPGKLALISEEVKDKSVDGKTVKQITSRIPMWSNEKNVKSIPFNPTFNIIALLNHHMRLNEGGDSIAVRQLAITSNKSFRGTSQHDPFLFNKLKAEADGILATWLRALQRCKANGFIIEMTDENREAVREMLDGSTPVRAFIRSGRVQITGNEDDKVSLKALYADYKEFCKEEGHFPGAQVTFGNSLGEMGELGIQKRRMRFDSSREPCVGFVGLKIG